MKRLLEARSQNTRTDVQVVCLDVFRIISHSKENDFFSFDVFFFYYSDVSGECNGPFLRGGKRGYEPFDESNTYCCWAGSSKDCLLETSSTGCGMIGRWGRGRVSAAWVKGPSREESRTDASAQYQSNSHRQPVEEWLTFHTAITLRLPRLAYTSCNNTERTSLLKKLIEEGSDLQSPTSLCSTKDSQAFVCSFSFSLTPLKDYIFSVGFIFFLYLLGFINEYNHWFYLGCHYWRRNEETSF